MSRDAMSLIHICDKFIGTPVKNDKNSITVIFLLFSIIRISNHTASLNREM